MLMKKLICFFNLCLLLVSCGHKSQVSLVSLVNPLMGTESTFEFSHGNTYPAVAVPGDEFLESADRRKWKWLDVHI